MGCLLQTFGGNLSRLSRSCTVCHRIALCLLHDASSSTKLIVLYLSIIISQDCSLNAATNTHTGVLFWFQDWCCPEAGFQLHQSWATKPNVCKGTWCVSAYWYIDTGPQSHDTPRHKAMCVHRLYDVCDIIDGLHGYIDTWHTSH